MVHDELGGQPANPFDPGYFTSDELLAFGFKAVGQNVKVAKNCTIIGLHNISIGSNVRIDGYSVLAAHSGYLNIGSYIHIAGGGHLSCSGGITISDFCNLSQGVRIYSISDDYSGTSLTNPTIPPQYLKVTKAAVHLGRHVIIGSGSVVLPGVTIGEGASIGALSLVNKSLDGWGIYAGTPARLIRARLKDLLRLEVQLIAGGGSVS